MTTGYELTPDEPKPRIDAPSLLGAAGEEPCPRCGKPLAAEAVVCVNCGFDLKANAARATETGVMADEPEALPEFVTPGRGDAQTIAIGGGVALVTAVVMHMIHQSSAGATLAAAAAALAVLHAALHTATGTIALVGTAWLTDHRLGRADLGVTRVFLLVAVFLLIQAVPLPWAPWLALGVKWVGGAVVYWALAMLLFRKGPEPAGMLLGMHFVTLLLVHLAIWIETTLSKLLADAAATAAANAPPAGP